MSDILTAVDIDERSSSISKEIESSTAKYIKSRVVKELNKIRRKYSEEGKEFDINEHKQRLYNEIANDQDTNHYRQFLEEEITTKIENYSAIRSQIDELNELHFLSAEIERLEMQGKMIKPFRDLVQLSVKNIGRYNKYCEVLNSKFDEFIKSVRELPKLNFKKHYNNLFSEEDPLEILLAMRKLYTISKDIDGLELYDMFNMMNNIEMSNLLSDICFWSKEDNLINILNTQSGKISSLFEKKIISNRLLGILLRNSTDRNNEINPPLPLVTNNSVTCYDSTYITTTTNNKMYPTRTIGELLFEIINDDNKYIDKTQRKQIYMTYDGTRPFANEYYKWNGLQVFDIDLKEWIARGNNINKLRNKLYESLQDFHWFLWICLSSSGKGIHIYTKVAPPHHIYLKDQDENNEISTFYYVVNYHSKSSVIYDIIYDIRKEFGFIDSDFIESTEQSKYETGFELKYLDNSVGRITSGIRLTYDPNVMVNPNFLDLPIGLNLCQTAKGFDYKKDIDNILLRKSTVADKFYERMEEMLEAHNSVEKAPHKSSINISEYVLQGYDISKYKEMPLSMIKYRVRYEVCNTLADMFGKDGLQLAHMVLRSEECKNVNEINAFYSSAIRNHKKASKFGLDILQQCGVVKSVDKEFNEELVDKYKLFLKKQIEKSIKLDDVDYDIKLKDDEYIGHKEKEVLSKLRSDKINLIYAAPSVGKTEFVKDLARKKRVMLVLPFISVIKNKIETDETIMELFDCYYDNKDISKIEHGINAVTTFDKFSRASYEKISRMFDYIVIDEEHLLFNSQYRINTTSNAVKKLRQLLYISSNDPFAAKIILMTGTPTGSEFFFKNNGNFIRIYKKLMKKTMEFHICDDILDTTTRLAYKVYQLIEQDHKIIIPTNKGDIYTEKMIGMVRHLLQREVKYGYYKRSNNEQEIVSKINNENTVGDYEIVFCSNYLSVGIDINDTAKPFAVLYCGNWSGFEIEQFNSRIRRQDIKSYYFVKTIDNAGHFDELLYEEPKFQLRLTKEDIANFKDDKAVAEKKQEFIAQYDPVLHTITTPGFSTISGQIRFNQEEYELTNFENKYSECYQHPLRVASTLAKYGYEIVVSTQFDGLDADLQHELKQVGIDSAKEEKMLKNDLLIGTFKDLININKYVSEETALEFNNTIEYIIKNSFSVVEDRDMMDCYVKVVFNPFAQPEKVFVRSKVALDKMLRPAHYLVQRYSTNKCMDIIDQYIDTKGLLRKKNFMRAINLLKLVEAHGNNELSAGVEKCIEEIYDYVDKFVIDSNLKVSYSSHMNFLDNLTNNYISYLGLTIRTRYGFDKLRDSVVEIFRDIAVTERSGKDVKFRYNKLPDQDSYNIINRRSVDILIEKMFAITNDIVTESRINPKERHIELETQSF